MTLATATDPWADVIGQPRAVAQLSAAAAAPVHAYLFVGPAGAGKRAAARAFAGLLLADGLPEPDATRAMDLALAGKHPDLIVVEPVGARISAGEARAIVSAAARSPVESARKVLVLGDMHRIEQVGPILLKTIEEPPDSAVFVVIADELVPDLVTIASRCVRVDFGPIPDDAVAARLISEGVDSAAAAEAAAAAAGDLDRARLLATDGRLAFRRAAWWAIPDRLDGTGSMVTTVVDELRSMVDESQAPLEARHRAELEELAEREERYGQRGSGRTALVERQKREIRRHRTIELRLGFATVAGRYRDALLDTPTPRALVEAIGAVHEATEALIRNPNETLLLNALLLRLPSTT